MKKTLVYGLTFALAVTASLVSLGCSGKNSAKNKADNEFEVATVRWADWGETYHEGFPDQAAKESGIDVRWRTILNSDWADKKAVLLAGGDLPDAFLGEICFSESEVLSNKGLFKAISMSTCQTSRLSWKKIPPCGPLLLLLTATSMGFLQRRFCA